MFRIVAMRDHQTRSPLPLASPKGPTLPPPTQRSAVKLVFFDIY
jgi:hypothetical protein